MATAAQSQLLIIATLKDLVSTAMKTMGTTTKQVSTQMQTALGGAYRAFANLGSYVGGQLTRIFSSLHYQLFSIASLAFGMAKAVGDALEFSRSIYRIASIAEEGAAGLERYTRTVKDLSLAYGQKEADTAQAFYEILSTGFTKTADATHILKQSMELAVAGVTSVDQAEHLLVSTLNAYNMTAADAKRVSDIYFSAVKDGAITIEGFNSAIGHVLPTASSLGISLEEMTAAMATLSLAGLTAEESGTQLRQMLANLIKPTKQAKEDMHALGLDVNASGEMMSQVAQIKSEGFRAMMEGLHVTLNGDSEAIKRLIPNLRGMAAAVRLSGNAWEVFNAILEHTQDSANATEEAFRIIAASPAFRADQLAAAWRQGMIGIGDTLLKELLPAGDSFEEMRNKALAVREALAGWGEVLKPVLGVLLLIVSAVAAVGVAIKALMTALQAVVDTLQAIPDIVSGDFESAGRVFSESSHRVQELNVALLAMNETLSVSLKSMTGTSFGVDSIAKGMLADARKLVDLRKEVADLESARKSGADNAERLRVLLEQKAVMEAQWGLLADSIQSTDELAASTTAQAAAAKAAASAAKAQADELARAVQIAEAQRSFGDFSENLSMRLRGFGGEFVDEWKRLDDQLQADRKTVDELAKAFSSLGMDMPDLFEWYSKDVEAAHERGLHTLRQMVETRGQELAAINASVQPLQMTVDLHEIDLKRLTEISTYYNLFERIGGRIVKTEDDRLKLYDRQLKALQQQVDNVSDPAMRESLNSLILEAYASIISAAALARKKDMEDGLRKLKAISADLAYASMSMSRAQQIELQSQIELRKAELGVMLQEHKLTKDQYDSAVAMVDLLGQIENGHLSIQAAIEEHRTALERMGAQGGFVAGLEDFFEVFKTGFERVRETTLEVMGIIRGGISDGIYGLITATGTWKSAMQGVLQSFARMLSDSLAMRSLNLLFGGGTEAGASLSAAAAAWIPVEIGLQTAAQQLMVAAGMMTAAATATAGASAFSVGTGWFGATGGIIPGANTQIEGYSKGGPIKRYPHLAAIGEAHYDEAVVPLPDGRSIPVRMETGGPGGAGGQTIIFQVSAWDQASVNTWFADPKNQQMIRGVVASGVTSNRAFREVIRRGEG